jgi:hypothetical protein
LIPKNQKPKRKHKNAKPPKPCRRRRWIDGMRRSGVTNFMVIAIDDSVAATMAKLGVHCWRKARTLAAAASGEFESFLGGPVACCRPPPPSPMPPLQLPRPRRPGPRQPWNPKQ